jgi:hypothetical protein
MAGSGMKTALPGNCPTLQSSAPFKVDVRLLLTSISLNPVPDPFSAAHFFWETGNGTFSGCSGISKKPGLLPLEGHTGGAVDKLQDNIVCRIR